MATVKSQSPKLVLSEYLANIKKKIRVSFAVIVYKMGAYGPSGKMTIHAGRCSIALFLILFLHGYLSFNE